MPEHYFTIPIEEQKRVLEKAATNKNAFILEKDLWVCWSLETLFNMPDKLPMAFKGGTSLSKVFNVIDRFSEDIDLTINYKAFCDDDIFSSSISKTKLKKIKEDIKTKVAHHINDTIAPYFNDVIAAQFNTHKPNARVGEDGETLFIDYPSLTLDKYDNTYIPDSIKLEFGGRNFITPNDNYKVSTYVASHINNLEFPTASVTVLSPEKTFWEKMTLIHYECNRDKIKTDANRISRHWYDVVRLFECSIGQSAIQNTELLLSVVNLKKAFYNASYANYDDCLNGNFKLLPNNARLKSLEADFSKMVDNNMFDTAPPCFEAIIDAIRKLQEIVNSTPHG